MSARKPLSPSRNNESSSTMMGDKKPSQYQYATLYEDDLLKQKKATNDSFAAALIGRASRVATLQCAIMDKPPTESTSYLQAMMRRMELEEWEKAPPVCLPKDARHVPLPPEYLKRNVPVSVVDVDAFFETYPECIRPNWDKYEEDDDSSSTSSDQEEEGEDKDADRPKFRRKKRPPSREETNRPTKVLHEQKPTTVFQNPYQQLSSNRDAKSRQHLEPAGRPQGPPLANFQSTSFNHLQQQPVHNNLSFQQQHQQQSDTAFLPLSRLSEYQQNRASNNTQSWEDHRQGTNPFQTAREYAQASSGDTAPPPLQQQEQQQRQAPVNNSPYPQQQTAHNPHQQHPHPQEAVEDDPPNSIAQGPVIRESLKRKFQPPKRGTNKETSSKSSSSCAGNDTTMKAGNNKSGKNRSSKRKEDQDEEDEDDLPEELKRYGKDLVEKIQNEIMDQGEPITFDDIAGLYDAKSTIQEIVCWPMKRPDLFTGLRRTPNGLLLFGPPGTGKTLIGKAIAYESGATFFSISSSSLTSKWIGEGEKLVRTLFGVAAYHQPAVVFIDEIDSLLTQRKADENEASRRIKTEFLVQLDGTGTSGQGRVLVIGATNRPQELDEAARRRFVKRLYIPLPDANDRCCLLKVLLEKNHHTLSTTDVEKLAADTEGFSGADLKALCADAAMGPIRQLGAKALDTAVEDLPPISVKHFRQSLRGMHASVSAKDVVQYVEFDQTYGSRRASAEEGDEDDCGLDE